MPKNGRMYNFWHFMNSTFCFQGLFSSVFDFLQLSVFVVLLLPSISLCIVLGSCMGEANSWLL